MLALDTPFTPARSPTGEREQGNRSVFSPTVGLYVHFPYCVTICTYCDFDRQAHGFELIPRYVEAVEQEIKQQPEARLHSVFFGGGTPSLMAPEQVARVLEAVGRRFTVAAGAEITLEANPDDLTEQKVRGFRAAGVNRMSIGVQSFHDPSLRMLGRRHSSARAAEACRTARAAGMENLNVDLMYGLPDPARTSALAEREREAAALRAAGGQSRPPVRAAEMAAPPGTPADHLKRWRETVERAIALRPEHLSCYLLTLESSVPMGRWVEQGRVELPQDEAVAEQYELARALLARAGYEQYEISNWAQPGRVSRHNLTYWRDEPYLGVGAGAASSWLGERYKNTPHVQTYIRTAMAGQPKRIEWERTSESDQVQDYLALTLRLREGLDPARFEARFGRGLQETLGEELAALVAAGHLEWHQNRLRVAERSLLVTNEVLLRLHERAASGQW